MESRPKENGVWSRRPAGSGGDAARVALLYLLVSATWIFGSDKLLEILLSESAVQTITRYQTFKGMLFVGASALLVYALVRRAMGHVLESQRARELSEERYRQLVELSPNGVFIQCQDRIVYCNTSLMKMLGATGQSELIDRPIWSVIHPADAPFVAERIRILREDKQTLTPTEVRFSRLDGTMVWVETTARPMEHEGKPAALVLIQNIDERIEARRRQRQLELDRTELLDRMQLILDRMPIACTIIDPEVRFTYWNPAAERIFGFAFDEVKGRTPAQTIAPPERQPMALDLIDRLREQTEPIATIAENTGKDGRKVTCSWFNTAMRGRGGEFLGMISMAVDITEQRRIQRALEQSQRSLARAQAIAQLGSWEWDLHTGAVQWSDEMYSNFDVPREHGPMPFDEFVRHVHPQDLPEMAARVRTAIESGISWDLDYRVLLKNGEQRYMHAQAEVEVGPDARPARMYGTVTDITARKRAEEELRQLNDTLEKRVAQRTAELRGALEDLHTFSYMVSHDLRAPLRSVMRFATDLLQTPACQNDSGAAERSRRIVAATARLERLIQDLLEYSQLSRTNLQLQRVSPILVVHEIAGQLQRDPDFANAELNIREPMPWVLANRPTLALVLQNLLQNAMKFVQPGTTPVVTVRAEDRGEIARIIVEDNGIGISPDKADRIFDIDEPLTASMEIGSTKDDDAGTGGDGLPSSEDASGKTEPERRSSRSGGIGLAIVRRGVERMGGRVGVESTPGAGSRFWIELRKDPQSP